MNLAEVGLQRRWVNRQRPRRFKRKVQTTWSQARNAGWSKPWRESVLEKRFAKSRT